MPARSAARFSSIITLNAAAVLVLFLTAVNTATYEDGSQPVITVIGDSTAQAAQLVHAQNLEAQPVTLVSGYKRRSRLQMPPKDIPAGTVLTGEYIVIYEPGTDIAAATTESQVRAASVIAAAAAEGTIRAASVPAAPTISILSIPDALVTTNTGSSSDSITDSGSSSDNVSISSKGISVADAAAAPADTALPIQALLTVPEGVQPAAVKEALLSSPSVKAVIQNRVITLPRIASTPCAPASAAAGITKAVWTSSRFDWPGCLNENTTLAFFGQRCGTTLNKFNWTGVYAVRKSNGQLANTSCIWLKSNVSSASVLADFFGDCGTAPTNFPELPVTVCMETTATSCVTASDLKSYKSNLSRKPCNLPGSTRMAAAYRGVRCGPNSTFIQWNAVKAGGCQNKARVAVKNLQQQAEWLGQCGVPPRQAKSLPTRVCAGSQTTPSPAPGGTDTPSSPTPESNVSPSTTSAYLLRGDKATWGMQRVAAYDSTSKTVVDASRAISASSMMVVTIDTGADTSHPDLWVIGIADLVDSKQSAWYNKDANGHGTHVAGIIGAKNNGYGVTGVVPGMPVYAIKVLGRDGTGMLSTMYTALAAVLSLLQQGQKIVAVNMSLTMSDGVTTPDPAAVQATCGYIKQIAAYGTAVVVAAGNSDGAYIGNALPALCPEAIAVTALDSLDRPAKFSNLARFDSPTDMLNRVVAAPGVDINSTWPVTMGSYESLDGTSMAAPFVTAGFAKCFLSGKCKFSSTPNLTPASSFNYPIIQATARGMPCGKYGRCAPSWGTTAYYGYMLDVRLL